MLVACGLTIRLAVMTSGVRLLLLSTLIFGIFTGLVYIVRFAASYPKALFPALFFAGLLVVWYALASKPPDVDMLRATYIKRLHKFENVRYVWGGETTGGIDCSGLARSSLWQAMLLEGIREFNPALIGKKYWQFWWRDISANDMLKGKYGYTKVIGYAPKLAGYDTSRLKPGDLAIANMESHVMVYSGDGKWIEANPDDQKVVVNEATAGSKRHYFNTPITFARWWILQDRKHK